MEATTQIPNSTSGWIANLPNRAGWGGWQNVGQSVYEGVQVWSETGDERKAVGVWGIVTEPEEYSGDEPTVSYSIYVGDCHDPQEEGFETAEAAMIAAEYAFPDHFIGRIG